MSNFSELCPLFNTGVFKEVSFPNIDNLTSAITSTARNFLDGTLTAGALSGGPFTFGRTVVVTDAFIRRYTNGQAAENILLQRRNGTTVDDFATVHITTSLSVYHINAYFPFDNVTDTTFTSNSVLSMSNMTVTATNMGSFHLIVRYKEA